MLNIIVLTLSIIQLCLSVQRCVFGDSQDPELRVKTLAGEVLGVRQAELDPRTNKTVRWRSYFVSPPVISPSSLSHPGRPVRPASCGVTEVPATSTSLSLVLPEGRHAVRGSDLSSD